MSSKRRSQNSSSPVDPSDTPIDTNTNNTTKSAPSPKPRRKRGPPTKFIFFRSLTLADFITLGNAACGTCSIFFCLNFLENKTYQPYINGAFILLPLALVFDICDGTVARWRNSSSIYGADLDSLADAVSFSVAPAVLGFTLGLRGLYDCIILSYFVCCGIGRLARFNVTANEFSAGTGKVKFYQGFPAPTSLFIVMLLAYLFHYKLILGDIPFGQYDFYGGKFHPLVLLYAFWGSMLVSEIRIPKP